METIFGFIQNSVEGKQFGWNQATFWALGAALVTFIQAFGSYGLARNIHMKRSGEGVSLYMLAYWHASIWTFALYGWYCLSVVMLFNALVLAPSYVLAIVGILRYERPRWRIVVTALTPLLVLLPSIMIANDKSQMLFPILIVGLIFFIDQPRKLYVEKKSGSFNPVFTMCLMVASVFWFFFALISVNDTTLMVVNPICFAISAITLHAYARAKRHEKKFPIQKTAQH